MFNNENTNINYSECVGTEFLELKGGKVSDLTPPDTATRAKIQCFLNGDGIKKLKPAKLLYTPVAVVTQSGQEPKPDYTGSIGVKLLHLKIYEITAIKNLSQTRITNFLNDLTCYCIVEYFK